MRGPFTISHNVWSQMVPIAPQTNGRGDNPENPGFMDTAKSSLTACSRLLLQNGIVDRRSLAQWPPLPGAEPLMTKPIPSRRSRASEAMSQVGDAAAAVASGVVSAVVKGVIGGIQGAASGINDGWRKGSQSVAGRPGRAWGQGVIGGIRGVAVGIRDGWSAGSQSRRLPR